MDTKATISAAPKDLSDRQLGISPIGPVCKSRTEYELYRAELELRKAKETQHL